MNEPLGSWEIATDLVETCFFPRHSGWWPSLKGTPAVYLNLANVGLLPRYEPPGADSRVGTRWVVKPHTRCYFVRPSEHFCSAFGVREGRGGKRGVQRKARLCLGSKSVPPVQAQDNRPPSGEDDCFPILEALSS